jgi:radical SAM superfamily enzyme YgiQ (UPF0313 family)
MKKGKVLFCTVPSLSLFAKKAPAALSLSMGASFIVGRLQEVGFDIDYYDLNLALGKYRDLKPLTQQQKHFLTDSDGFFEWYFEKSVNAGLNEWVNHLVDNVIKVGQFRYIALSLDRRDYSTPLNKASFHFSLVLAKYLKKKFGVPVFAGGRRVYETVGEKYIKNILSIVGDGTIDKFSPHESFVTFTEFLEKLEDGMDYHSDSANALFYRKDVFMKSKGIVPNYSPLNAKDSLIAMEDLFPREILRKYPKIESVDPFVLAPYKFTVGCQFKCAFCRDGERSFFNKSEVEDVLHVLSSLYAKGISNFLFYNNNINFHKGYVRAFCDGIKSNNLKIQFSDSANLRIASPEVFSELVSAGCVKLYYGTETVSDRLLKIIQKQTNRSSIEQGLRNASEAGIYNGCNFIFNFPHETDEEFQSLVDFTKNDSLVDTCFTNEFKLLVDTAYWDHPEKFEIRKREVSDNGIVGAFDEVGGLRWEQKVALGRKRDQIIFKEAFRMPRAISQSDPIVFGLRRAGFTKLEVKKIMGELKHSLELSGGLRSYENYHQMSLTADQELFIANSIHNNEFSKTQVGHEEEVIRMSLERGP